MSEFMHLTEVAISWLEDFAFSVEMLQSGNIVLLNEFWKSE